MRVCTEEDYAKFYTPDKKVENWLERIKNKGGMMCIDWVKDRVTISNQETDPIYQSLDIKYLPCNMRLTRLGGEEDRIPEDCTFDRDELMEYLGPLKLVVYHNHGEF